MNRPVEARSADFGKAERLMGDAVTYAAGFGSTVFTLRHLMLTDDEWRQIAALDAHDDLSRAVRSIRRLHHVFGRTE